MLVGVNVDPRHGYAPVDIVAPGSAEWVRSVVKPDHDLIPWLDACYAVGGKVLVVVARESMRFGWTYAAAAKHYRLRYGGIANAFQIGNEPDIRSPSSWTMKADQLNRLLRAFRKEMPAATLIGPGLVSGNPSYLDGVDISLVDAIAVHPYGRGPTAEAPYAFGPVEDLIALYRRFNKPIWVTEFGGPGRDFTFEHERATYHGDMLLALRDAHVENAIQFCWADSMGDDFGLIDAHGAAKESYAAFYAGAIAAQQPPTSALRVVSGIDVSSYQPRDLSTIIVNLRPEHVLVRMYLDMEAPSADHSRAQMESTLANGCSLGPYFWLYRGADPVASAQEAIALAREYHHPTVATIDVEPYGAQSSVPTEDEVLRCIAACFAAGVQPIIYTGKWVIDGYYGGTHAFADAGAWLHSAQYDYPPASVPPLDIPLYGGWTQAHGHQWTSTPVDQNVFLSSAT